MTTEAWTSLKTGVCYGTSMVSGLFAAVTGSQTAKDWIPVFVVGVITAAMPGFLAWLQTKKIHTAVNSERTALLEKLETYHKEVAALTAAKATSDQSLKDNVDATKIADAKIVGAAEEKAKSL